MSLPVVRGVEPFEGASQVDRLRRHVREIDQAQRSDDFQGFQLDLQTVRTEFEAAGMSGRASILDRVGMLVEVWECLIADDPRSARAIADFCQRAPRRTLRLLCSPGDG